MRASDEARKLKTKAKASLTLLLVAIISISTATYAWFTLSNSASVQSMEVRVGTSIVLKVDTIYHATIDDYKPTLTTADVNAALTTNLKYSLADIRLWPLTSGKGVTHYTESTNSVAGQLGLGVTGESRYFLELPLWFMANEDMNVYLNGDPAPNLTADEADGTKIFSKAPDNSAAQTPVEASARVAFIAYADGQTSTTVEKWSIYEPNKTQDTPLMDNARTDAGTATQATFVTLGDNAGTGTGNGTDAPVLFRLTKDTPKRVVVRLWIEGQDPQCVNGNGTGTDKNTDIEKAKLIARLRFCGADDAGNYIEGNAST